ncbi:MAG: hypothetical protein ACI9KE_004529 [Polyangiales bacterium]
MRVLLARFAPLCLAIAASTSALLPSTLALGQDRFLWVAETLSTSEAPLRVALTAALDADAVTPDAAHFELRRHAATLDAEPLEDRLASALEAARDAYVRLDLAGANEFYDRALRMALEAPTGTEPASVARVFFEQYLVLRAAEETAAARAALDSVLTIRPDFGVDASRYGRPVIRAIAAARQSLRNGPAGRITVGRSPADAEVHIDGQRLADGEAALVRGTGMHLVTATRFGYAPRAELVTVVDGTARVDVVLTPAEGPQLAALILARWGRGEVMPTPILALVARALDLRRVVEARIEEGQVVVTERIPGQTEILRQARGTRTRWEPEPFAALAADFAGEALRPPEAVSLAVLAPAAVAPGRRFELEVNLRDPDSQLRALRGECGESRSEQDAEAGRQELSLRAPNIDGDLDCVVFGIDRLGQVIVRFPEDAPLRLNVTEDARRRVPWWVWASIGVVVAGAAAATAVVLTRDTRQELVIQ